MELLGNLFPQLLTAILPKDFLRALSVDIVASPVQRRFAHRGKFQKLLNDRGELNNK